MPEHPLWFLPAGTSVARPAGTGRGPRLSTPGRDRQRERIGPQLERLQAALEARRLRLVETVQGAEPELVLVIEVAGSVREFAAAVRQVDGLEWLLEAGDLDLDDAEFGPDEGNRHVGKTLYLLFTDARAMQQLRTTWERWQRGDRQPYGFAGFGRVFEQLVHIRPWGPRDRVAESGLHELLAERSPDEAIRVEAELWYRHSAEARAAAEERVGAAIAGAGGTVVAHSAIEQIRYQGLLAELPVRQALELIDAEPDIELGVVDDVMHFRPLPQGIEPSSDVTVEISDDAAPPVPAPEAPPIVAILDGAAQANHPVLQGRVVVEDPDEHDALYTASERAHGTAMASLVTRGDLNAAASGLSRRVLVRPILVPDPRTPGWVDSRPEVFPPDQLPIDVVHRALHEFFEGTPERGASAPSVRVINLSVGDQARVFAGLVSPMARLLDWAAAHYQVLFVVSAGNHDDEIQLDCSLDEARDADDAELEAHTLRALHRDGRLRGLFSPGESANALTVGAAPDDAASPEASDPRRDPITTSTLAAPYSALGRGVRRSVKPDVVHAGGRLRYQIGDDGAQRPVLAPTRSAVQPPGVLVAAAGGPTRPRTRCEAGTSHAAALTTRFAARLHDVVESMPDRPEWLDTDVWTVLLKALVVHATRWGRARDVVARALRDVDGRSHQQFAETLIGYGRVDPDELLVGDPNRVVLLGGGHLRTGQAAQHQVPLPPSLSAVRGRRRVTTTLAWFTPCTSRNQRYRGATLSLADHSLTPLADMEPGPERTAGHHAARRGTVEHHVKSSHKATPVAVDDALAFRVDCGNDALDGDFEVPYALVVTLDVAPELDIDVYTEVTTRVRPRVPIETRAG